MPSKRDAQQPRRRPARPRAAAPKPPLSTPANGAGNQPAIIPWDTFYCWLAEDATGQEGVVNAVGPNGQVILLMNQTEEGIDSLRQTAAEFCRQTGMAFKLYKYSQRELVDRISPLQPEAGGLVLPGGKVLSPEEVAAVRRMAANN